MIEKCRLFTGNSAVCEKNNSDSIVFMRKDHLRVYVHYVHIRIKIISGNNKEMKVRLRFMKQYSHIGNWKRPHARGPAAVHYVLKRYITSLDSILSYNWSFLAKLLNKNQTFGQPIWHLYSDTLSDIFLPIDFHICLFSFLFSFLRNRSE